MPQDSDKNASAEEKRLPKPWWRQSCPELLANVCIPFKILLFPFALACWMTGLFFRFFHWLCIHPRMKLAAFPALLVIPAAFLWIMDGGPGVHTHVHWTFLVSPEEAAPYESPLRELVSPVLTEKYALEECEVMYTRPARYRHKVGTSRFVGMLKDAGGAVHFKIVSADHKRRIEIAQDIIRMKRELPGLPKCPYVLEFERIPRLLDSRTDEAKSRSAARAVIAGIVIPDEERGYDGRGDWHFDDFTPTPGGDEEARK